MTNKKIICRCEEVTESEIVDAIKSGATTLSGIARRTRAMNGLCQGKTCQRIIAQILSRKTGQKMGQITKRTVRPPVRAVELSALLDEEEK